MNGNNQKLFVFFGKHKIAEIELINDELNWHYAPLWKNSGFSLSPALPLNKNIPPINAQRFLRNLLPEGLGLDEVLQRFNLSKSNTFALSLTLGNDLPGALMLSSLDKKPLLKSSFRKVSIKELISRLDFRETEGLVFWDNKPRLSVAGVQDKINLLLNENNEMGFGEGDLCSTHILKFEKKTHTHLAINEFISMKLAKSCGLSVAECNLIKLGKQFALLIKRFDRKLINPNLVKRRHVIDGCQALNLSPDSKYEQNFGNGRDVAHIREGASLKKLFKLTILCENPVKAKLQLIDWLMFNLLIFNFDAHGKNISFFISKTGLSLTPFYDLVNIAMYPHFDQNLAMALGDEFDGHMVNAYQLADFAEQCQLSRKLVSQRLTLIAIRLIKALKQNKQLLIFNESEKNYLMAYKRLVNKRAKHLLHEALSITTIEL